MRIAARLLAASLWAASFVALFVSPVSAGTQAAPELTDNANDQALTPEGQALPNPVLPTGCTAPAPSQACLFTRLDILSMWIDNETADNIQVNILFTGAPGGATTSSYIWQFSAVPIGGTTAVVATATATGGATTTPPAAGQNVVSAAVSGNILQLTIAKSIYAGTGITTMTIHTEGRAPAAAPGNVLFATDDAAAAGTVAYTFGASVGDPFDSDADGLNDTWEQTNFGDLNETAEGDPDADGLNNTAEFDEGTDPNDEDTDDDGASDGDEVAAGTNPLVADGTTTTTTPTDSTTTAPTDTNSTSTTTGGDGPGGDGNGTTKPFADRLTDAFKAQYLPIATAGAGALILLSLIGRFGRWGL